MTRTVTSHDIRSRQADRLLSALPHGGRDAIVLRVQCARSHHVAKVYRTPDGLVYAAPVRARSHGHVDLPDTPHKGGETPRWLDFLYAAGPEVDDGLPGWCDCGHRTLSRRDVQQWVDDGEHRVVVD